jgi:hypothetical protein
MARADIPVQQASRLGLTPTYTTVLQADGASFANDGTSLLHIWNTTGAGDVTVSIAIQATVDGQSVPDKTYTVGNTTSPHGTNQLVIGPFPPQMYNDQDAKLLIDVSADGCVMAVLRG